MIPSLKISGVKHFFNLPISSDKTVPYGIFARYVYNKLSVNGSLTNFIGYSVAIVFVASITAYLFRSVFRPAFSSKLAQAPNDQKPESNLPAKPQPISQPKAEASKPSEEEIAQPVDSATFEPVEQPKESTHIADLPPYKPGKAEVPLPSEFSTSSSADNQLLIMRKKSLEKLARDIPEGKTEIEIPVEDFEKVEYSTTPIVQTSTASKYSSIKDALQFAVKKVGGSNHIYKEMKYRHVIAHLVHAVTHSTGVELHNKVKEVKEDSLLKRKCLELYQIIIDPNRDIREQHQAFILALREARTLLTEEAPVHFKEWIEFLALQRFARTNLFSYCKNLVETQTGKFDKLLTLDTFVDELESRNKEVQKIPDEEGLTLVARAKDQLLGHLNYKDFLLKSNIPYIYGYLKRAGQKDVTILRHGTPIDDSSFTGWVGGGSYVTSDYIAFIEAAKSKNENILHLILENGVPKSWYQGNESHRVKDRLALGDNHENFYPMALRLDGHFVQPVPFKKPELYQPITLVKMKEEFSNQVFGNNTGYCIPQKLQDKGLTKDKFETFIDKVKSTFFEDEKNLNTLQDYQAFIVLTYAEMVLSLCDTLGISYLEALCKDDIDRGNVMKAVITILHLYRTKKFAEGFEKELSQALENLMVNLIGAPLVIRKDDILESRVVLVENVIAVLRRTVKKNNVPQESYEGNFNVISLPLQSVVPIGPTCHTVEEYQEFLGRIRKKEIDLTIPIEENIVQVAAQNYMQTKDQKAIRAQLNRAVTELNMHLNGNRLNPERKKDDSIEKTILDALKTVGISEDEAWPVLSAFTQSIEMNLTKSLNSLFGNRKLGYGIKPDSKGMQNDQKIGLYLTTKQNRASIKLVLLFNVSHAGNDNEIAKIHASIEIPDHREAKAIITAMLVD